MTWVVAVTYRRRVLPGSGKARISGLEMSALSSSSALCVSSVQWKELGFFNNLYMGSPCPPSRDTKRLNILDVPDLAYFSDGQNLVRVCFDAALVDDVPQELAPEVYKGALLRVQFNVELSEVVEGFFQVGDEGAALSRLHNDVINIDLQVAPYLPLEAELHTPLVCGPCVLQSERHFHVAETKGVINVVVG
jgi:hypothetical protein